ncbi:PaaI family thioesterase [Bacillaceae bacterium]
MDKETVRRNFESALENHANEFEKFFLARFFDLRISYEDERCIVEVPVADYMFNPQGSLHGGVIAFILDVSMGHLCKKVLGTAVTLEMKVQYFRPVQSGLVRCEASFLKKGKKVVSLQSKMYDAKGELAAFATGTWHRL